MQGREPLTKEQRDCLKNLHHVIFPKRNPNASIFGALEVLKQCPQAAAQVYKDRQPSKDDKGNKYKPS